MLNHIFEQAVTVILDGKISADSNNAVESSHVILHEIGIAVINAPEVINVIFVFVSTDPQ